MALTKEQIIKLPKHQKAMVLAGIILVLAGLFYYLLYSPKSSALDKAVEQLTKLNTEVQAKRKAVKDLEKYKIEVAQLHANLKMALKQLPDEKEIPNLLKSITEIAKRTGLETTYFKQETNVRKSYYSEIPVNMKVAGDYHSFAFFLYEVGKMPRILQFSKLALAGIAKEGSRGSLEASLMATTYKFESEPPPQEKDKDKKK